LSQPAARWQRVPRRVPGARCRRGEVTTPYRLHRDGSAVTGRLQRRNGRRCRQGEAQAPDQQEDHNRCANSSRHPASTPGRLFGDLIVSHTAAKLLRFQFDLSRPAPGGDDSDTKKVVRKTNQGCYERCRQRGAEPGNHGARNPASPGPSSWKPDDSSRPARSHRGPGEPA